MNKKLSMVAFAFFSVAWAFDMSGSDDIIGLVNVGLMWITLAAIVGREKPNVEISRAPSLRVG